MNYPEMIDMDQPFIPLLFWHNDVEAPLVHGCTTFAGEYQVNRRDDGAHFATLMNDGKLVWSSVSCHLIEDAAFEAQMHWRKHVLALDFLEEPAKPKIRLGALLACIVISGLILGSVLAFLLR